MPRGSLLKAALLGGVLGAVLSSIPYVNLLCCAWVTGAGVFAAWVLSSDSAGRAGGNRMALGGLLAGAVAGLLTPPLTALVTRFQLGEEGMREQAAEIHRQLGPTAEQLSQEVMDAMVRGFLGLEFNGWTIAMMLIMAAMFGFFGLLGGLIGGTLLTRQAQPPSLPPPPPVLGPPPGPTGELPPEELPELPPREGDPPEG